MKSSVKVPYLYLTTDPQIVTKLTFDQGWLPTIADLGDVDFVIGPSVTDKLIGFELNYNYEGQKYGLATLEFVDIDGNLESRFIQKSANFIFTNYYSTLKKNPELASDYEEYSKIVNTNKTPKFFLGFGLSENISEWSGPYIGSVIRTDMSLDGTGLKKITVQLQLTDNSFELKTHDPAIHKGYISDIVARNLPQVNMVAAGGVVMPILEFLSSDPTDVLSSAISDYLKVVSDTKNILTILPDLSYSKNLTLSKQRQKDVQAGTSTFSIFGIIPASNKNFNSFQKFDTSPSRYSKKLNYSQYQDLVYFPTIRKYYKNFGADVIIIPETYEVVKTKVPKKRATTPPKVANDNSFNSRDPRIPENLGRQLERLSSLRTTYSQELKRAVYNQDQQAQQDASKKLKKAISDSNQLKAEIQQKYLNQPEKKQTPSEDDFDYQEKRIAKDVNWVNATPSIDADMAFYEENSYLLNLAQSKVLVQFSISSEQSKDETGQESNTKPDFYLPIKKLTEGFNNFKINDSFEPFKANFGVFYENNPTIVKKWMEYNLLENKPERDIDCVLLLTSDQIRTHWVYGHTTPMNIDITQRGECPIQQKFVDVFNNKDYRKSLSKISKYFKKGSSFNELDSLEGSNQLIKDVFRLSEDFNVETSMSVFLSNTKNSNVISFNLATYPQYIGIFNYGIETLSQQLTTDTFAMADAKSLIKGAINSFDKDLKPIEKELLHYFFDDEIFRGLSADVMKRREGPVSLDPSKNTSNLPTQQDKDVLAKWNGSVRRAGFDYKINKDTQSSQVYKKIDGVFKKLAKNNDYGFDPNAIEDSKKLMEAVFTDLSKNEELEGVDLKLKELVDTVSPDKLAAFLTKIYTMNKSAFSTKIVNYKRNPKYLQEELFRFMSNSYLELNIKTLPFFHVDGSHFGKNCLFVHNELVALPLVARRFSFLTGLYFINGFRHIINSSECYSEFSLKKVPTSIEDGETENETQPEIEDVEPSESPTPASPAGPITGKGAPIGGMFGADLRPKFEFDAKDPRIPDRIKDRYIRTLNAIAEYEDAEVSGELELTREPDKSYLKKRYDENRLLRSKLESDINKFTSPSVQQELNNKNRTETTSKQQETRIKVNTSDSRIPEELRQRYNQTSQEKDNAVLNLKRAVNQNDRVAQAQYSEDIKTANRRLNAITVEMAEYTGQLSSGTSTSGVRRSE